MPAGTQVILDARTLVQDHRRLVDLLKPGMRVLDVGCGTGAITRGIAEAVAPTGEVVGVDINADLIRQAQQAHGDVPNLTFRVGEGTQLSEASTFDLVTAARVLQWLAEPLAMLQAMVKATKPGGCVVMLDYNHEKSCWQPQPPNSMQRFYAAFLRWRAQAGMDNAMVDHLAQMFSETGLVEIKVTQQHEITQRGEPDFGRRIGIWADVAATRGHQIVADGFVSEDERAIAEADYRDWMATTVQQQTLYLLAVEGRKPV